MHIASVFVFKFFVFANKNDTRKQRFLQYKYLNLFNIFALLDHRFQHPLIVVSDIFGLTTDFQTLARGLCPNAVMVDPYSGQEMEFESESVAYDHFMEQVGLDRYTQKLEDVIKKASQQRVAVLGFSVGGTAVWCATAGGLGRRLSGAYCFYGSQIRNNLDLRPKCDVQMVLPKEEPNFSVEGFKQEAENIPGVEVLSTPYLHGFMNTHSKNYSKLGAQKYSHWLKRQLNKSVVA